MTEKSKTKAKRIKKEKNYQPEEEQEVKQFIKILIILIILVIVVYVFTRIFVTKDLFTDTEREVTAGEIDYSVASIGTMFNRSDEEYYVILYDTDDLNAVYYSGLVSSYSYNDDALNVYTVDLGNELNKNYVTTDEDEVNVNTTDLSKFKVGSLALIKVKNGKITASYTSEEDIAEVLAVTSE